MRRRALLAGLALPAVAAAQSWPDRPVTVVLPYQPGGATDTMLRALAGGLQARLGQPVVVVNRDGAAGAVGTLSVMRAPADGYTLAFVPAVVLSVLPVTRPESGLRADGLVPVCQAFSNAQAVVVRPDSPLRDLRDLQRAAQAAPGRINYGSLGTASVPHLAMVEWLAAAGAEMTHVPYRGDGPVMTEVLAGRLEVGAVVLASLGGRTDLRVLGVFDGQRNPGFPEVPTAMEQGFDVAPASFGGLMAPRGTPEERIRRLEAACLEALGDEAYRQAARRSLQPERFWDDRAGFARRLEREVAEKAAVLRRVTLE
ncbi:tripartite tricarboxylate transporter substrate binding protein [Roseococcus sp. DSY-14]|uniref:tripartite tricarboxylate transporter substrate binding protein n=1 Tax=Roseococcus sp. DSY-14 TaxID=3369650 RepID=UPI00387B2457